MLGGTSKPVNKYADPPPTPKNVKREIFKYEPLTDESPTSPPIEAQKRTRKAVCIDGHVVHLGEKIAQQSEEGDEGELVDESVAGDLVAGLVEDEDEVQVIDEIEPKSTYVALCARVASHIGGGFESETTMLSKSMVTFSQFDPIKSNPIQFKVQDVVPYVDKLPGACSVYGRAELLDLELQSSSLIHEAVQVEHSLGVRRIKERFEEVQSKRSKVPFMHRIYRAIYHWP